MNPAAHSGLRPYGQNLRWGQMTYFTRHKAHEHKLWQEKKPLIGQIDIELTERCNNNCIHCLINRPENDQEAAIREMDTAMVKDVLTQAATLGCLAVRFTGGEPLIRHDFSELYMFARRLGMKVILFTNGRLITPELAKLLAAYPPLKPVEISVYGMSPKSYDASAGKKGAFMEYLRGVELLRQSKVWFVLKSSILPPNRDDMEEFESFLKEIDPQNDQPRYAMNFDLRARRDDFAKNERIRKLRLTPEETLDVLKASPRYIDSMEEFCGKFMRPPGEKLFSCGAGHGTCVDAYGFAQMCMGMRHPDMVVNLRRFSLKQALTKVFTDLRTMRPTNIDYIQRCSKCFLKGLCEQCPAKSWMEHGTLDTPVEYLCDVAHAQAIYLGLIKENEKAWQVLNWQERIDAFSQKQKSPGEKSDERLNT